MQAVDGDVLECARGDQSERALELGGVEVEGVVGDGDGGAVEGGEEDEDFAEVAGGVSTKVGSWMDNIWVARGA